MTKDQQLKTQSLPSSPGIYIFRAQNGVILYVGKASNLRSRVRTYFAKTTDLTPHKQMMVKKIADIEIITASSETEALILESVLIKKHQPPYNVVLKDDKNYQFIKIDYRPLWPIVTTVRRPELDRGRSQARYFGPYTSASELYEGLRLLRRIFPWRKKPKEPTQFERDLLQKQTLGPLPQTDEEYQQMIIGLTRVLEGKSDEVVDELTKRMKTLSSAKQFERAARLRDQITALKHIQAKQKIISLKGESQDVVSVCRRDDIAAVNVFVIREGKLIDKLNFILQYVQNEDDTAVLDAFLKQFYTQATNPPKEIVIPLPTSLTASDLFVIARERSGSANDQGNLDNALSNNLSFLHQPAPLRGALLAGKQESRDSTRLTLYPRFRGDDKKGYGSRNDMKITIPHRGKKRELVKLGEENAREYLERSLASWQSNHNEEALDALKNALHLDKLPIRIEGYDISNIQGKFAVGSMVVFTNGVPDKNQYRKFKIKSVAGANDPLMLAEVLKRRFAHADWPKPDLVLLDGGKGQLTTVLRTLFSRHPSRLAQGRPEAKPKDLMDFTSSVRDKILRSAQDDDVPPNCFIALAKKQEEIFQGSRLKKINLNPRSPASLLLQRVRDEAHRFARAYYHLRHSKTIVIT